MKTTRVVKSLLCTLVGSAAVLVALPSAPSDAQPAVHRTLQRAAAPVAPVTHNHFVTNLHGEVTGPRQVGFNVWDSGTSVSSIRALPWGVRALVWLGQKCPTPPDAAFKKTVSGLAGEHKVFAYYLSDEPHIADCPGGPRALAAQAAYVRSASGGRQRSFIVLSKAEDFKPFRTAVTGVDMVGMDPYPCSVANPTCDIAKIAQRVQAATSAGIELKRIVPTYQAFGQAAATDGYYNLPTADQMRAMVAAWAQVVPAPLMDYTYSWGHQSMSNPTLVDSPRLQAFFTAAFSA